MAVVPVEVPEELAERLERECSMLGFEEPETYLRWLVDNRAALHGDDEQNRILAAYAERVDELENRLEEAEANQADAGADPGGESEGESEEEPGSTSEAASLDDFGSDPDAGSREEPSTGVPDPTADAPSGPANQDPDPTRENGGPETYEANLAPATGRISDDTVTELADALQRAQGDAVDEMARQAVAKTRRQLGESTETGIDYDSTTALRSDGPRPGSEIADLDSLEVPGYDDELVARRREAVGAALALLKDVGEARRSDFLSTLYEEYPAGYSSGDGWWECIKRGLRQVDRVDAAGDGSRTWRYRDFKGRVRVLND